MMSDYEKLRLENISRNQAFLESIGLADVKQSIAEIRERDALANATAPSSLSSTKPRRRVKRVSQPTALDPGDGQQLRRSNRGSIPIDHASRLLNETGYKGERTRASKRGRATNEINVDDDVGRRKKLNAVQLRQYIETCNADHGARLSDKDIAHNAYRMCYMSNQALATRIAMISSGTGQHSRDKMLIFYYALSASGLSQLAASALDVLCEWQVEGLPHR